LLDKAKTLKAKLTDIENINRLFAYLRFGTRRDFNMKLEETIGLIMKISEIILFEFGQFPEDISLKNPPKLPRSSVR
jgi:hypothetical protein